MLSAYWYLARGSLRGGAGGGDTRGLDANANANAQKANANGHANGHAMRGRLAPTGTWLADLFEEVQVGGDGVVGREGSEAGVHVQAVGRLEREEAASHQVLEGREPVGLVG